MILRVSKHLCIIYAPRADTGPFFPHAAMLSPASHHGPPLPCSASVFLSLIFILHLFSIAPAYDSRDHPQTYETGTPPHDALNQQLLILGSQVSPHVTRRHGHENIPTEVENCQITQETMCFHAFSLEGVLSTLYPLSSFCQCVCPDPQRGPIRSKKHPSSIISQCFKNFDEVYCPGIAVGHSDTAHLQDSRDNREDERNSLTIYDIRNVGLDADDGGKEDIEPSSVCKDPASTSQEILNSSMVTNSSKIHLRQEIDGRPFNYASDSKGAKALSSNREAKGAMNILNKDKDKYFWTPCNAEITFVDIELSEETLVVEIVIANYEFFSSNVRDFQLWGSSTYPVEEWVLLGKFEAENCRTSQKFTLSEPKWVRYIRLEVLSHYGSDFYCTLSALEVHGVDAIEWLLEEWFVESYGHGAQKNQKDTGNADEKSRTNLLNEKVDNQRRDKAEEKKNQPEYHQIQRPTLDTVMKLMMEKIRSLEQTQPHFLQLKELDDGYKDVLSLYVNKLNFVKAKLEESTAEVSVLNAEIAFLVQNWYQEKHELESESLKQISMWTAEFDSIRSEQKIMENKQLVALMVAIICVLLVVGIHVLVFWQTLWKQHKQNQKSLLSVNRILWIVPLLSSILVVIVLLP